MSRGDRIGAFGSIGVTSAAALIALERAMVPEFLVLMAVCIVGVAIWTHDAGR